MAGSSENLKTIRFEGELLPNWAQLLNAAARLSPASEATRRWFSRFTNSSGVDDARTIIEQVTDLQQALQAQKAALTVGLQRTQGDVQAERIFAAWEYALETMVQQAHGKQTCSWTIEGVEDPREGDFGDGDITRRRV